MSLLVQQIAARITGDDNAAKAAKIARKCVSSVKSQISAQEANEVDLEDALEAAQEKLDNAQYPTSTFTSGQDYVTGIKLAQARFDEAEEALEVTRDSITYFKALQSRHNGKSAK
tara:strand:+ start:472 stop:816 length:345 start_codon:yes stop_codon:yes gene_type:complete